jgi:hypothetical protein
LQTNRRQWLSEIVGEARFRSRPSIVIAFSGFAALTWAMSSTSPSDGTAQS